MVDRMVLHGMHPRWTVLRVLRVRASEAQASQETVVPAALARMVARMVARKCVVSLASRD